MPTVLDFDHWILGFIWNLGFEIWNFRFNKSEPEFSLNENNA
jgi:hypothetical protein